MKLDITNTCAVALLIMLRGANSLETDGAACNTCQSIPHAVISPCASGMVCGVDQNTYGSFCLARCQGVEVVQMRSCDNVEGTCFVNVPALGVENRTANGSTGVFTDHDLKRFPGFRLLGKVHQSVPDHAKMLNKDAAYLGSGERSGVRRRSCSVFRLDEHGNKYVRDCSNKPRITSTAEMTTKSQRTASVMQGSLPEPGDIYQNAITDPAIPRVKDSQIGKRKHFQAHRRGLHAIIGEDNRQPIDSSVYPYTTIGQLRYTEVGSGAAYLCTGTLFSERHVITNAHCVYNKDLQLFHSGWEFSPGLAGDVQPFGTVKYQFYDIYTEAYVADFKNWDVAIITLQEPIGLQAGWMGVKALPPDGACSSRAVMLPKLHAVGYPVEDSVSDHAYADVCDLYVRNGCEHDASSHKCDTKVGNSGSPLFEASDVNRTKWLVRAIHFAGLRNSQYNLAIPIDDSIFKWMECYRTGQAECAASSILQE